MFTWFENPCLTRIVGPWNIVCITCLKFLIGIYFDFSFSIEGASKYET